MKNCILLLIFFAGPAVGFCQFNIDWQHTYGGTSTDEVRIIEGVSDGGFIVGGFSSSGISATKSEAGIGGYDYWVIKYNAAGIEEWQNTIGGSLNDNLNAISETSDGGFILGGTSTSLLSGDKTEVGYGSSDYWIVKLDASGNIEWDKTIGGSGGDDLHAVKQTSDGGYIIGGNSTSGVSGNKNEPYFGPSGMPDYWVVKLSAAGNIEWQKTLGGNNLEVLANLNQNSDGTYIVGGYSLSGLTGNKTEASMGNYDYWIVKLDSTGGIIWQNTIGGNNIDLLKSIVPALDGGYVAGGYSSSGLSGDKTEGLIGIYDFWVVKLDDNGNIVWQNTIGGTSDDYLFSIVPNPITNSYLLAGYSYSGIGGDKTENGNATANYWMVETDVLGSIINQETFIAPAYDFGYAAGVGTDGSYMIGGKSNSGIGGDKTEANNGDFDYWVIKTEGACIPTAEICNSLDDDCNGVVDDGVTESITITAGGETIFCQGGSVELTATYTGTSLQWKRNGTNIPGATSSAYSAFLKGVYSCLTSSDCNNAVSNQIIVNVQKNPPANITAGGETTFCAGDSVVLSANAGGGLSYQWFKGASVIPGATSLNYTAAIPGNYRCRVTKIASGCFKNSNAISVNVPCREGEELLSNSLFLYPNPASTFITVQTNSNEEKMIELTDVLGQTIKTISSTENNVIITLENIPTGIYIVNVRNNREVFSAKFIKN